MSQLVSSIRAEFRKLLTVRSSIVGLALTFLLSLGFGALISALIRHNFATMTTADRLMFDPLQFALAGVMFAQFALGVIGIQSITSEFATGSISTTLAATPRGWKVLVSKAAVIKVAALVVSTISVFVSFFVGIALLKGPGIPTVGLGDPGVIRQLVLTILYLVILSVLGMGIGLLMRHTAGSISIFVVTLLILPIIDMLLPSSIRDATFKYLPSSLGRAMMTNKSEYLYPLFGPYSATLILSLYALALVGVGLFFFNRRDV